MTPAPFSLQAASLDDGAAVYRMVQEIGPGENGFGNQGYGLDRVAFKEYLRQQVDTARGHNLAVGWVPQTTYWLLKEGYPLGLSKLRHRLNEALEQHGGHIGYCIRPSERGKGYGRQILALTLDKARGMSINDALVTISADNIASLRVAESCGGRLVKTESGLCYYRYGPDG